MEVSHQYQSSRLGFSLKTARKPAAVGHVSSEWTGPGAKQGVYLPRFQRAPRNCGLFQRNRHFPVAAQFGAIVGIREALLYASSIKLVLRRQSWLSTSILFYPPYSFHRLLLASHLGCLVLVDSFIPSLGVKVRIMRRRPAVSPAEAVRLPMLLDLLWGRILPLLW